jgi:hypothetical protein
MPVATRSFPNSIPATVTQASLLAGIRDALVAAGFPIPLKQYQGGTDLFCIWRLVFNAAEPAGTCFYRIRVTTGLTVSHNIGSGFNDSTNALTGAASDAHLITFTSNFPINFAGFQSSELILCLCTQGTTLQFNAGYLRLENAPQWDDRGFCRVFICNTNVFASLSTITPSPYGTTVSFTTSLNVAQMAEPDLLSGLRSSETPFKLYGATNSGIIASSSNELGMGANSGMALGSIHVPPNTEEEWYVTRPGPGTLIIRVK